MKGIRSTKIKILPEPGEKVKVYCYDNNIVLDGTVKRIRATCKLVIDTKEEGLLAFDFLGEDGVWRYEEEEVN